jgi:ribosome-binding protein aMBF1 (putative translation factor)
MFSTRNRELRRHRQLLGQEKDYGSTKMRDTKKKRLEAKGWKVGSAKEFLGLSSEEEAYIEIKSRLAEGLREQRLRHQMTQADLARKLNSSQSRVAKMEAGESSVSLDLLVRSLLALGASSQNLIRLLSTRKSTSAS